MIATIEESNKAKEIEKGLIRSCIDIDHYIKSLSKEDYDNNYDFFMSKVEERTQAKNALREFQANNRSLLEL